MFIQNKDMVITVFLKSSLSYIFLGIHKKICILK